MVGRRLSAAGSCQWFYARPDARLRPGIGAYRGFGTQAARQQERLVAPSGRVSLLIGFEGESRTGRTGRRNTGAGVRTSLLSGPHARARVLGPYRGGHQGVELTLAPWAAYRLFGTSLGELADTVADPADVLGGRFRDLGAALEAAPGWQERFALLDETLLRWEAAALPSHEPSPAVLEAWWLLARSAGALPIGELAERTGWSMRYLEVRFREQIGLTPKRLARVLRLNRAVRLLSSGSAPADVAAVCGYYDQAHLSREFTAMTGMPPGRFLAARGGASA